MSRTMASIRTQTLLALVLVPALGFATVFRVDQPCKDYKAAQDVLKEATDAMNQKWEVAVAAREKLDAARKEYDQANREFKDAEKEMKKAQAAVNRYGKPVCASPQPSAPAEQKPSAPESEEKSV
jgi:uncharacterized protein (DUF3084 family)